jgi:MoaA/NifB/PqqE/SkfB family radical SAM enzyme
VTGYSSSIWTVYDYIKIGLRGIPPRSLVGIDVTNRCNLRCGHRYFSNQHYQTELSVKEWLAKFEKLICLHQTFSNKIKQFLKCRVLRWGLNTTLMP